LDTKLKCYHQALQGYILFISEKSPKGADYSVTQTSISMSSTPEYLKEAFEMKKPKYSRSPSNGEIQLNISTLNCSYNRFYFSNFVTKLFVQFSIRLCSRDPSL